MLRHASICHSCVIGVPSRAELCWDMSCVFLSFMWDWIIIREWILPGLTSRPRVGLLPLTRSVNYMDGPKGLVDRWKSPGRPVVVIIEWKPVLSLGFGIRKDVEVSNGDVVKICVRLTVIGLMSSVWVEGIIIIDASSLGVVGTLSSVSLRMRWTGSEGRGGGAFGTVRCSLESTISYLA